METTELRYPVFEANQVLGSGHLNDMFAYLDEQSRLTRADLIGIGIVCGLEVRFEPAGTVHLSRGCGVTSQGYLVVEPDDLALTHVRAYRLPSDLGYQPFMAAGAEPPAQLELWELFPDDDEPGSLPLAASGIPLRDRAVVLFLELRHDRTRVCSPNDCDDRGGAMTTTVRRLLVDVADLDALNASDPDRSPAMLGGDVAARLALPDLRMPRFDVPESGPVTAEAVLAAFHTAFRRNGLVASTAEALSALYRAFRPLVAEEFPTDPFAGVANRFRFLDAVPVTRQQVVFLQYYWDLFDDLLAAYDELRWKGVELVFVCCPPEWLFRRHLTLGVLHPDVHEASRYRHRFVPSPATGESAPRARAVRTLFRRLVAMLRDFTEGADSKGVRLTPSLTRGPLSQKAIPYYYVPKGSPRLADVWDPVKTERGRANQNLGYRADEHVPPAPVFATDPLRFDLEPNDFLRIEGHLGGDVHAVLRALIAERTRSRLPFDVIALRTGAFDDRVEVDLADEDCRFEDLDTLYRTLVAELRCFLVKQVEYFYDIPVGRPPEDEPPIGSPKLDLLRRHAPKFVAAPGTLGSRIEGMLAWEPGRALPFTIAVAGVPDLQSQALRLVSALSDLAAMLADDVGSLDFEALGTRYALIVAIAKEMEGARRDNVFDPVALQGRLDDIVYRCRLEPFEALELEYRRRIRELKQAQFLGHFLQRHPGIQHKAGVPLGGTFILVYHQDPPLQRRFTEDVPRDAGKIDLLASLLDRVVGKASLAQDPDVLKLSREWVGLAPALAAARPKGEGRVFREAVAGLADGTIIADFFLPYGCRSNCPPIQYQLPPTRLKVRTGMSCTNADGVAEVRLTVEGVSGVLSVMVDDGAFQQSDGTLLLSAGQHRLVVRDASGNESSPVEVTVPRQLVIGEAAVTVDRAARTFQAVAPIDGGTPPYSVEPTVGTIVDSTVTSAPLGLSETLDLVVTDAAGCTARTAVRSGEEPCDLPCGGDAIRQGHRFWLPEPPKRLPIKELEVQVERFELDGPEGPFDLTAEVRDLASHWTGSVSAGDFAGVVRRWLRGIERIVAAAVGSDEWLRLEYQPAPEGGDAAGVLLIDRLACLEYRIELVATFLPGGREVPWRQRLVYDSEGTRFKDESFDGEFELEPFAVATTNKCEPEHSWVERCESGDIELDFRYTNLDGALGFRLEAVYGGSEGARAFLWEIPASLPPTLVGEAVEGQFDSAEPSVKRVRVTVYTESGCTATLAREIDTRQE